MSMFHIPTRASDAQGSDGLPVDPLSTVETRNLCRNLFLLTTRGLLFGMQDACGYGVGWSGDDDRSDVRSVCGDFPALISEDLNRVQRQEGVDRLRTRITSAYIRGSAISLCWHIFDPDRRGFYAGAVNNERVVASILPGGAQHEEYARTLESIALFLHSLIGPDGEPIPVIFRPFHEHTGDWFWWGAPHATSEEYIALWRFTAGFLRDTMGVHSLLWAFSPALNHVGEGNRYFDRYPGDAYVDIFGADAYFRRDISPQDLLSFRENLRTVVHHARRRNKLVALTEVGQEGLSTPDWFTRVLLGSLKQDPVNSHVVYAAVWRNAGTTHHFAPYPGHTSVPDFLRFYHDPYTLFLRDLPPLYAPPATPAV
jgi:mannan endo-1,4-beta-mannosidase